MPSPSRSQLALALTVAGGKERKPAMGKSPSLEWCVMQQSEPDEVNAHECSI